MRLPFSAALDVLLTVAGSVTVAISEALGSPSCQEAQDAHNEAKDSEIESCPRIAEQLTNQILGELNSAVGAMKNFSSGRNTPCVSHHPNRCNML